MCVQWECAWCQCQILVLEPAYPTLHKYAHSTSETSCVSTGNVRGASAKYWYQHQHIQHYTNTPKVVKKLHVCPLGMCVVLVPNIGISTSISNTTQIRPQHFRKVMCVHWECAWWQCQILVLAPAYPTLHNTPTALQKLHACPLGMCVVLVPNIGISTSISNTTQIRPQNLRNFMCVHWECAWCQCQILVLAPAYPTLHKYAHNTSETSCVSTANVRGASAKYWYQHQHIQHYTNTPTALQKGHVCPLGMCVVLVPNIGISTSISNTTQRRPQHFRNFMCVHWECAWCQCQILVLAPAYPTLPKYAHSTSETSCLSTGNVRGASAKYWYQHQHIQHFTNTPTVVKKLHVCPLGMCVVLVPNIGISTSISNTTQIRPQHFRKIMCVHWECAWCQCQILVLAPEYSTLHKYAHSTSERSCVSTGNVRGASAKYWYQHQHIQHYTNTPTVVKKLHVCPLGMCVDLVPNFGISTSISNTTQIRPQHFRNFMCVHWECAWCQCQILVLAPAYPTLHKYAHSTSETSCASTGNVRGASAKYWYQHQHIQHYTNTPTVVKKLHVCPLGMCVVLVPNIGIIQHQHIQHYTNTPTALQKGHVCPLGMCVVLVPNIGISTSISNTTQIRPQHFRKVMCVHWECAWWQCQILVLAPAYPTLHNTPTALQKLHACPLGMCVVLVPNIGISTSISNTTQIRPQNLRNFMCVHWECAWCQCQILVLAPAYPTLHKYAHNTSENSCFSTANVRGASDKYWYQHQHIQHYTNTPTALQKGHVCPLGMCVVLVPNIGISTSISNSTQRRPQHFRNFMCVHWECAWCQCQILVLAPAYPTLPKYAHSTSETSCLSTGNVRGASAKYWYQHQHIQLFTNTPTVVKKLHVCPLGMCVVLVPNIGISTSISNTTQIRPQHFRKIMCVHWECAWCQCQILVLAPEYSTLHKYAHSTSERSCVSTGNVRGASAKYWYQHQHIQHYTNTPTVVKKLHVCPLGMCVDLVPNFGISTSISNTTQIRPQHFRNFMCVHWECAWCQCQILVLAPAYPTLHKYAHSTSETSCASTGNVRGASAKYWYQHQHIQHYTNTPTVVKKLHVCPLGMCVVLVPNIGIIQHQHIQHYTNTPTALQKGHVCPLGMCVVLVPNIGISTSISNTTQIRPQHFRKVMCVHWECAWWQCQILVLAPAYPTLHNTPTALQKLHACPLGMCVVLVPNIGISTSISNTTQIRPQNLRNFMCVHWECAWCQCQILVLAPAYPTLHKYAHSTSERSCVSTGNVRGASAKYWYQHQHIQHYTKTPTALQKLHVCPLGMCVVLVPNIGISTSISNITQIRPQHFRNFMLVHRECAWCQCQILVLAPAYPTFHKYAYSS